MNVVSHFAFGGLGPLTLLEATLLGIVQGLTEFLPVSSSGHLVVAQRIMGIESAGVTFEVMVHFGSLLAVLVALKDDWIPIAAGIVGGRSEARSLALRQLALLVVGSVPVALIGLLLRPFIEEVFKSPTLVGWLLLATGAVLWAAERMSHRASRAEKLPDIRLSDALLIGCGQAVAILPGISRSGMTLSAGLALGVQRETAARFAFLLSIPAIVGATLIELPGLFHGSPLGGAAVLAGSAAAALSGYAAIRLLLVIVKRGSLVWFSGYTWLLGLLILIYLR